MLIEKHYLGASVMGVKLPNTCPDISSQTAKIIIGEFMNRKYIRCELNVLHSAAVLYSPQNPQDWVY
jgi:hypothetical protein